MRQRLFQLTSVGVVGLTALTAAPLATASPGDAARAAPAAAVVGTRVAQAEEDLVVRRKSLAILLKVLSYDRNLEKRVPGNLHLGVVARSTDSKSVSCATMTMKAVGAFKGKKIKGKEIKAQAIIVESAEQAIRLLLEKDVNTVFLSKSVDEFAGPIAKLAARKKLLVLACDASYVKRGVAAIAVVKGPDNRPKIIVNLDTAKAQGANLDARVLKIAEAVKK